MGNYEIDTIFYFCPNEQTYASQKNNISPRTIVFVEDSKKIYKNKSCYGGGNVTDEQIREIIERLINNGDSSVDGLRGADGKSAYDIAVDNGYSGTVQQWLLSLHGRDGVDGADGRDGADGQNTGSNIKNLSQLNDVNITNAIAGDILVYTSGKWKNQVLNLPSGGTTVVANPSDTASTALNKLKVGTTTYSIPTGQSTSVSYTPTVFATGVSTTTLGTLTIDSTSASVVAPAVAVNAIYTSTSAGNKNKIATISYNGNNTDLYAPTITVNSLYSDNGSNIKIASISGDGLTSTDIYIPPYTGGGTTPTTVENPFDPETNAYLNGIFDELRGSIANALTTSSSEWQRLNSDIDNIEDVLQDVNGTLGTIQTKLADGGTLDGKYAKSSEIGDILDWMFSGFKSNASLTYSYNDLLTAARSGGNSAISSLHTSIERTVAGYLAEASLTVQVDNAITGIKSLTDGNTYANTTMFSQIDVNTQNIASIVQSITGESASTNIANQINNWKSGLVTKSTLVDAVAGLAVENDKNNLAAAIMAYINESGSNVLLSADKIRLQGTTFIDALIAAMGRFLTNNSNENVYIEPGTLIGWLTIGSSANNIATEYDTTSGSKNDVTLSATTAAGGYLTLSNDSNTNNGCRSTITSRDVTIYKKNSGVSTLARLLYDSENSCGQLLLQTEGGQIARLSPKKLNVGGLSGTKYLDYDQGTGELQIYDTSKGHTLMTIRSDGYSHSSDIRLKNIVEHVNVPAEQIASAPIFKFKFKDGDEVNIGTSAQYWQDILPEAVTEDDNKNLLLNYEQVNIASVINLAKEVVDLKKENDELKARLAIIESKLGIQ